MARVYIIIEGGIVQNVLGDPGTENLEVAVVDWDTEEPADEDHGRVELTDGVAYIAVYDPEIAPGPSAELREATERLLAAAAAEA
jgi:hypothetical protein